MSRSRRRSYAAPPIDPHFIENGVIEERVSQIKSSLSAFQRQSREDQASFRKEVSESIDNLTDKLERQQARAIEKGNVNWFAFGSFAVALFVATMSAIAYGASVLKEPIEKAIARNAADIAEVKGSVLTRQEIDGRFLIVNRDVDRTMSAVVKIAEAGATKMEVADRLATIGKQRDESFANLQARIDRHQRDIDKVQDGIVTRGEHARVWASEEQQNANLQRQMDDVKKSFGDTFSLRDALQQMQKRIDALEAQKLARGSP